MNQPVHASSRPTGTNRKQRHGGGATTLIVFLVLMGLGIFAAGTYFDWKLPGSKKSAGPRIITHEVKRGTFVLDTVERGEIESFDNLELSCEVKAQKGSEMTILEVVPEGTIVKPGDVVVQLDSASLEQDLIEQQISCNSQEAKVITSKNTYQAAEISLREYKEGTYEQLEQEAQSAIFIAEETLQRAKEYLAYSERLSARGYVTPQQLDGDRFALKKAQTELDAAETKLRVLQEFTKPKQLLSLESDIRSAKADWDSDQSSYKLELAKLEELKTEIDKCQITSPIEGQVIYANQASSRSNNEFVVEAGASVREGRVILRIPKSAKMQVEAKVNESRITDMKEGLKATVRIEAFGDRELEATVTHVNEYPEATSWYGSQTKEYATEIRIIDDVPGLRPGLTAEVTIHISRIEDAILIPVQGLYERGRRTWCFRKSNAEGSIDGWEAVAVTIEGNNDNYVTISGDIEEGDLIALNPKSLAPRMNLPEPETAASSREALGGRPSGSAGGGKGRPGGGGGERPAGAAGGRPSGATAAPGKTGGRPAGASGERPGGAGGGRPAGAAGGRPPGGAPKTKSGNPGKANR